MGIQFCPTIKVPLQTNGMAFCVQKYVNLDLTRLRCLLPAAALSHLRLRPRPSRPGCSGDRQTRMPRPDPTICPRLETAEQRTVFLLTALRASLVSLVSLAEAQLERRFLTATMCHLKRELAAARSPLGAAGGLFKAARPPSAYFLFPDTLRTIGPHAKEGILPTMIDVNNAPF